MTGTAIAELHAWEALDSRGRPTVGAQVLLDGGASGRATVPSGASTGRHEARELRDGGTRYGGYGVRHAVANVTGELADAVRGLDATDQLGVDRALRDADGTEDLGRLGANAVLAVSVGTAVASAAAQGVALHNAIAEPGARPLLPLPMVNIISGGAHAGRTLDVQDFLAVPLAAGSFGEAIECCSRVRAGTAEVLADRGLPVALVADEGGLGPMLPDNRSALDVLVAGIERAGLQPGTEVGIAVDVAATQFETGEGEYTLAAEGRVARRRRPRRRARVVVRALPHRLDRGRPRRGRLDAVGPAPPRCCAAASCSATTCSSPTRDGSSAASTTAWPTPSW